jgi:hypothetical protein
MNGKSLSSESSTYLNVLSSIAYSLCSFQSFPNVFIIHWEKHCENSFKKFNTTLIYKFKPKKNLYYVGLGSKCSQVQKVIPSKRTKKKKQVQETCDLLLANEKIKTKSTN